MVVAADVAEQLPRAEGLEAHRGDAALARQRQDLGDVPLVDERTDGKHHEVAHAGLDRGAEHVGRVGGDPAKAGQPAPDTRVELLQPAAGLQQCAEHAEVRQVVKDERVGVIHPQPSERSLDLRHDRRGELVDLGDDEHPVANPAQRVADHLLRVPVLVVRRRIDDVEPRVHGAPDRRRALLDRDVAIGEVTDTERAGEEAGAAEGARGMHGSAVKE